MISAGRLGCPPAHRFSASIFFSAGFFGGGGVHAKGPAPGHYPHPLAVLRPPPQHPQRSVRPLWTPPPGPLSPPPPPMSLTRARFRRTGRETTSRGWVGGGGQVEPKSSRRGGGWGNDSTCATTYYLLPPKRRHRFGEGPTTRWGGVNTSSHLNENPQILRKRPPIRPRRRRPRILR